MMDREITGGELMNVDEDTKKLIAKLPIVHLSIERMQGSFYAWDAETNKFLGQGVTPAALFKRLAEQSVHSVMYRVDRAGTELLNAAALDDSLDEILGDNA